jgi:hypothetical protein
MSAVVADTEQSRLLSTRLVVVHRRTDVPTVLPEALKKVTERKRIERFRKARDHAMSGGSLRQAAKIAQVGMRRLQRVFTRYLELADDGRIAGERAFLKNWKLNRRVVRTKPYDPTNKVLGAMTGVFRSLMDCKDELRADLIVSLRQKGREVLTVNRLVGRELRKLLDTLCEKHGIAETEYPRCTQDGGLRALRRWIVNDFMPIYARDWIAAGNPDAARALTTAQPAPKNVTGYEPYCDAWMLDAVKVDLRTAIEMLNLKGDVDILEIERFKVLRLIELGYNSNLAYLVVYGREPNAYDLGELLWRALNGWVPKFSNEIKLEEGAAFIVMALPELRWKAPKKIYLDNALAHLSATFGVIVELTLGADLQLGTAATPLERPEIESKFASAARRFIHQVPGTTGSGTLDPQRKRFKDLPPEKLVRAEVFDACYYMLLANENASCTMASFGIPAIERMRRAVARNAIDAQPISLTKRMRHTFFPSVPALVHAGDRKPYINFKRIRYTSKELQMRHDLVGKYLYVCCDPSDLRVVVLYSERGDEVCRAHGEGRWGVIPHDVRMRNMALRNIDKQALRRMPQDAPLELLFARLEGEAPSKPSAALQYAHCLAVLGQHLQGDQVDAVRIAELLATCRSGMDAAQLCAPALPTADSQDASSEKPKAAARRKREVASEAPPAPESDPYAQMKPRNAVRLGA